MQKGKQNTTRMKRILASVLFAGVVCAFLLAVGNMQEGYSEEGRAQLEQVLRRTAVACYATEGKYPQSLEYMQEHYGVVIDEERYLVFYEVFADNLMPDITVLEKGK
jgi:hypothetical protein